MYLSIHLAFQSDFEIRLFQLELTNLQPISLASGAAPGTDQPLAHSFRNKCLFIGTVLVQSLAHCFGTGAVLWELD